jgi:hypothetical protein
MGLNEVYTPKKFTVTCQFAHKKNSLWDKQIFIKLDTANLTESHEFNWCIMDDMACHFTFPPNFSSEKMLSCHI